MKVITRKIKPMRVAFLRHVGPYEETGETWFDLMTRLSADKQLRQRSVFIGMGHDNPTATPASELRYDACITVDEGYEPKKPVELQTIAGGDYAVAKNCPVRKIKDAFHHLYGKWLAQSTRELRPAPGFMVFVNARDVVARRKRPVLDVYLPLQPKRPLTLTNGEQMNIEITTLQPRRVAYMRHVGPYDGSYRKWADFTAKLGKNGLPRRNFLFIGVPMDNPKITPPEKLRFDTCVTIDGKFAPATSVRVRTIAGGDYAVARNCQRWAIGRGYQKLFSWLPQSGRRVRKAPSFLVAVNGLEGMRTPFGLTDIYVPLEGESEPLAK